MNVADLLAARAAERPDAVAIIEGGIALTFRALDEEASHVAARLRQHGIGAGDGVLVLVPMSAALYAVLAGVLRLGAVCVFPDPSSGIAEIERCCQLNPPAGFIGIAKAHVLRLLSPHVRRIPRKFSVGRRLPGAVRLLPRSGPGSAPVPPAPCTTDSPAVISFTSGTTGRPKAALRTHGFLLAQQEAVARSLELAPGDVDLATLPMFVLANLAAGVTSVIPEADLRRPGGMAPGPVLAQIRRFRPNRASGSPAFFERLAAGARAAGCSLDSFERIYAGGAPVFPGCLDRIAAVAPRARVAAVYGSTEAEPIAHVDRAGISAADRDAMVGGRGLLAGRPVQAVRLAILPDRWGMPLAPMTAPEFTAAALPAGDAGEVVVTGPHVLRHYLHGAGDEETKFRVDGDVWHRTGDAGWLDGQGRLWLLGRCAARVTDSRGSFYPFSVECAAAEAPGIRRAAALALHGRRVLVLESDADGPPPDVARLRAPLAWASLDEIRFVPHIPVDRRHNAKVDYGALARLLESRDA